MGCLVITVASLRSQYYSNDVAADSVAIIIITTEKLKTLAVTQCL